MARYRFVDAFERVFTDLVHGDTVAAVKRRDKDTPDEPAAGSTLVLRPGDEVTLTAPVVHPLLAPVDGEAKAHAKKVAEDVTLAVAADAEPPAPAVAPAAATPQE